MSARGEGARETDRQSISIRWVGQPISRQIDVQGLEIFRQLAIFMSHLRVITRWSAAITKVPSTPEILTGTRKYPPLPSLSLAVSLAHIPRDWGQLPINCGDLSRTITKLLSLSLSIIERASSRVSCINSSLCQIPNTCLYRLREGAIYSYPCRNVQLPPEVSSALVPSPAGTEKVRRLLAAPFGLSFSVFLVPKNELNLSKEGRQFTQHKGAPLGAFFVLSAISNWTSSAYCAPLKELKICLWNFRGAAIYVSPYAAGSFTVSTCMCLARISHISPGIYIKTLYEIIKHSGRASSHHTPNSIPCFFSYWSNILNSFEINRT